MSSKKKKKVSSGDVMPNDELSGINKIISMDTRLYRDPLNNSGKPGCAGPTYRQCLVSAYPVSIFY